MGREDGDGWQKRDTARRLRCRCRSHFVRRWQNECGDLTAGTAVDAVNMIFLAGSIVADLETEK